ncbi:MAG TPA: P-type conjugative transfer protein TrbL [Alphaproteobacteria bacterium]|nr:P-type conjugative transfer protein TrbL [Alphaproteobacteria bacterium]
MGNLNIIDQFMQTFIRYIDSGFGLLNGDVAFLTSTLVAIDITLAGLFWVVDGEANIVARLIKKTLYIGTFAFILNNFSTLSAIVFNSFAGLGLHVANNGLTAQDLLRPGKLAGTGFQAAWPLLQQAGSLVSFSGFLRHAVMIIVLVIAWFIVILAFFILAVQLFITILEFKLTSLAGFVLVPFAFWNRTSFLAERVLGNVVSSGIKVMVLAVIVGIGASFFNTFVNALQGQEPSLSQTMSLVLASITLFGLGIFGPGIASGLVSGAPQLGAGAAIGTAGAVVAGAALTGAAALGSLRGGLAALRAGTSVGAGASAAYGLGQATSGARGVASIGAGMAGVGQAAIGAAGQATGALLRRAAAPLQGSAAVGRQAAWRAKGGRSGAAPSPGSSGTSVNSAPEWAQRLRSEQRTRARAHTTTQAIKEGDKPGAPAAPDLSERE